MHVRNGRKGGSNSLAGHSCSSLPVCTGDISVGPLARVWGTSEEVRGRQGPDLSGVGSLRRWDTKGNCPPETSLLSRLHGWAICGVFLTFCPQLPQVQP